MHTKVDCCFKLFTFTMMIFVFKVFSLFYVYNFSFSSKYKCKKKICSKHRVSIYAMIFVLLIHINSVTQKISHCKIIYQSQKRSLFFICKGKMCVNFLKYLFEFFSTNFIVIDVSRKQL